MKNIENEIRTDSIIFTHGDSDGICSGAIAKSAYPEAHVYFTSPVNLLKKLDFVKKFTNIVICDIAIDERTHEELYRRLDELAMDCNLVYIDHHPLPHMRWDADWFYHDLSSCASELTYRVLEDRLSRDMRRIAIYGAIGDFCDDTSLIMDWSQDWDKRNLYFQAGTLIQSIFYVGRNYDFKRYLIEPLSNDTIPSMIPDLLDFAKDASELEEKLRIYVKANVKKLKNIAYIMNANGYMSKSAIYASSYGGREVGISAEYRERKHAYDISIRSRGFADVNRVVRSVTKRLGGTGGGHSVAAGARVPADSFDEFLHEFDKAVGRAGIEDIGDE